MIDARSLLEAVRRSFPDWQSFADPRFENNEITYKKRNAAKAHQLLGRDEMARLLNDKDYQGIIGALEAIGQGTNLLYVQTPATGDLGILYQPSLDKEAFCTAVFELLHGKGAVEERLQAYSDYVAARGLPNKWTFATYFLFMLYPETEFFVKPGVTGRFLQWVGEQPLDSKPSGAEYRRVKAVMRSVMDAMAPHGPRDMVDIQALLWTWDATVVKPLVSRDRRSEFERLFQQFAPEYFETDAGRVHASLYGSGRDTARTNWNLVTEAVDRGQDSTDLVLLKLLPYADSPANRSKGAWIHCAPCVTGDIRGWFEGAGWAKAEDWPEAAKTIYALVRRCVDEPGELAAACADFARSRFSKGFQSGMISPILNALAPKHFSIVNSKSRKVLNHFAGLNVAQSIADYPEANSCLRRLAEELDDLLKTAPAGLSAQDTLDAFCHWLVAVQRYPFRDARCWKIAPGENASDWHACRDGGYISIGWDDLGDVSGLSRAQFSARVSELLATHPEWTKARLEQVWKFSRMREGDTVVANRGTSAILGVGTVTGPYYFVVGERHGHRLPVSWDDTRERKVSEDGWRRTLIELDRAKLDQLLAIPAPPASSVPFPKESFDLLSQLHDQPTRAFYEANKARFKALVEEPLQTLLLRTAAALHPDLRGGLETKSGIFSRIPKNDYGRGGAWDHYWGALFPVGKRRVESAQLYVLLEPEGLRFGFGIGQYGGTEHERFVANWHKYQAPLARIFEDQLSDGRLQFGDTSAWGTKEEPSKADWLADPAKYAIEVGIRLNPGDVSSRSLDDLVTDVASIFAMLHRLVIVATSADPLAEMREVEDEAEEPEKPSVYPIERMAEETFIVVEELVRWVSAIDRKRHLVLYGPPGTGKTFVAQKLADHLVGGTDGFKELVQFHPSYSYEDFMQGIRPKTTVDGGLSYALQDGLFKGFCERARARTGPCVLVVDEINRANLSRVFGELMFLLEYREQRIPLGYGGSFAIPENVRIIGTMNTADRSIAVVDHALRRRFAFVRLSPNYEVLRRYHEGTGYQTAGLISVLKELNDSIADPDYQVGILLDWRPLRPPRGHLADGDRALPGGVLLRAQGAAAALPLGQNQGEGRTVSPARRIIELREYETSIVPQATLPEAMARRLWEDHGARITIERPTFGAAGEWRVTPSGWAGWIPLSTDLAVQIAPRVPLANMFGMLEYAYRLKTFHILKGLVSMASLHEVFETLVRVLAVRVLDRARRGLYRSYVEERDAIPYLRGRLDVSAVLARPERVNLPCEYDENTADLADNQILAWTLYLILLRGVCSDRSLPVVRKAYRSVRDAVTLRAFPSAACLSRVYNRLNADYSPLHALCRFFLDAIGPSHDLGANAMVPFLVDMAHLFELFVAEWLREHLPAGYRLEVQENVLLTEPGGLSFQIDLVLYEREAGACLAVLDTKYKIAEDPSAEDVAQVVAYAAAKGAARALLVYPRRHERAFAAQVGGIRVAAVGYAVGDDLEAAGRAFLADVESALE